MKKCYLFFLFFVLTIKVYAQFSGESTLKLLPVVINLHDQASLQRGARFFMNYCSGCHSLRYLRYNRMGKELGLTTFDGELDKDLLINNLIFTTAKIYDPIRISMPETDARQWFGKVPPDLSLTARERGAKWIYTYLKSFYVDRSRPFGSNNLLVPNVAMPNVLAPLLGRVIAVKQDAHAAHSAVSHLVLIEQGEMTLQEFDSNLQDLVNFLVYAAEPAQLIRYRIGIWVLLFLSIFLIMVYRLKKAYWQGVHSKFE